MRAIYYGRVSTQDGQTAASQYAEAAAHGVASEDMFIDEEVSGYHVAPADGPQWQHVERDLRKGSVLVLRWLDRISRRYDELHATMRRLMDKGVRVECTLNGMVFDGAATDAIAKATRDAVLVFMAAQGEADYLNRREMQRGGIEEVKPTSPGKCKYKGRVRGADAATVAAWRAENGASIAATGEHFGIGVATVKRYCAEVQGSRPA